ncbi:FEKKY domain-containing protein [Luteirhabdus pelagi]|uniref:FEKKY domain-containing protein n=1 Tax=Luteirhabdus pelagi TaxID=2792783 RepID=UPI00193A62C7|nr:hypothetical protein [Luteirhabdus pelagi]
MKKTIIILFGLLTFSSIAQTDDEKMIFSRLGELTEEQLNSSGALKLNFISSESEAKTLAEIDIKNGNPFLFLVGGIAPVIYTTDLAFEKKYDIYLFDFGCTGPQEKYIEAYNEVIFEYLTNRFGKKWKKDIRKDVIGLKKWKK